MRMKKLLLILLCLLVAAPVFAVTYSFVTTAAQETRITRIRQRYTQFATNDALIQEACRVGLKTFDEEQDAVDAHSIAAAAKGATLAQKQAACSALGKTLSATGCN